MLPGRDGFALLAVVRRTSQAAVLMLTARDALADRLLGLTSGADDYLVKPFAMAELVARVTAVLRRSRAGGSSIAVGDLVINDDATLVQRDGAALELTDTERRLLGYLAAAPRSGGQQDPDPDRGLGLRRIRRERGRGARLVAAPQAGGRRAVPAGAHRTRPRVPARRRAVTDPGPLNPGPLNTVSLRLRVTAAVIIVLALVLILLSVAVNAIFVAQSNRNLDALLTGRAQLARQLARSGVGPQQIVNRVDADGVQAYLVLRNGAEFGSRAAGRPPGSRAPRSP